MKLGSLFDGIGGFPLSAAMCGIEPVWASEIEPFPILTTYKRFPQMKHLGNISEINGAEVEPVDILSFGSPCQDLSVAGKQAGIHDGERSSLFFEAVRIIKEMRENDRAAGRTGVDVRCRWAVWENVPGAFSSHGGADFQAVLQTLCEVADPDAYVPLPEKGKWDKAGCVVGEGWSVAWRVYDAQYWGITIRDGDTGHVLQAGTPQRRKRIYLVADFGSERAGEILFEQEGVRGDPAQGRTPWQGTAADPQGSTHADDREGNCLNPWDCQSKRCYGINGVFPTLYSGERSGQQQQTVCVPVGGRGLDGVKCYDIGEARLRTPSEYTEKSPTLTARCGTGGNNVPAVAYSFDSLASNSMKSKNPNSGCRAVEVAKTLDTTDPNPSKNQGGIAIVEAVPYTLKIRSGCEGGGKGALVQTNLSATPATNNDQYLFQPIPIHDKATRYAGRRGDKQDGSGNGLGIGKEGDPMNTLTTGDRHAVCYNGENITSPLNKTNPQPGDPCHTLGTDSRNYVVIYPEKARTLTAEHDASPCIDRGQNVVAYALDQQGGKGGGNYAENVMPTICSDSHGTPHAVVCDARGNGDDEISPTLTGDHQNRVTDYTGITVHGFDMQAFGKYSDCGTSSTLKQRDYKDATDLVVERGRRFIVRRLTPLECCRLQGYPDGWTEDLAISDPTEEEIDFFTKVWADWAAINGTKPKSRNQVIKWLTNPQSDSAEYKAYGNSLAIPCAFDVIRRIAEHDKSEKSEDIPAELQTPIMRDVRPAENLQQNDG